MSTKIALQDLPDYPALCQLREALWGQDDVRGAAVMVGAGFSRSAKRASASSPIPPLWSTFEKEMAARLYPSSTKSYDPLKLAEEYRAALGEAALDSLIRRMVADDQWLPSELHSRLLALPWTDVLTTNWDTLLERTSLPDPDRSYEVVRTIGDIARTRSPRIVKLHGSLPAHKPFVFTAEEFRTYPKKFSAFINLAQQALLENEFCLVGFSGDDPNFLQWAGWVRDQLGDSARRIRLVGALELSPSQRQVLEQRNIFPIDLAPLVDGLERDEAHERATEIFLNELWQGKPKPTHHWARSPVPHQLPTDVPATDIIQELVRSWQVDRTSYPGWLVAPHEHRASLHRETGRWYREMRQALPKVDEKLRGKAIAELAWRYDIALEQLDSFLVDIFSSSLEGAEATIMSKVERIRVANSLLTQSRYDRDDEKFAKWLGYLKRFNDPEVTTICLYEEALKAKGEFDFSKLAELAPQIKSDDPVWHLRRAHLYCALRKYDEARKAISEAVTEIRGRRARDRKSIWLLSREAWASWLWYSARWTFDEASSEFDDDNWPKKYHATDCDPWDHIAALDRDISEHTERQAKDAILIEPQFDAGSYKDHSKTIRFTGGRPYGSVAEAVRLSEIVGLPQRIGNMGLLGGRIGRLVQTLPEIPVEYTWLAAETIQDHSKGLIDFAFGRIGVARLTSDAAIEIAEKVRAAIAYAAEKHANGTSDWIEPLRVYLEILSRLMIRQTPERAKEIFLWGIELSSQPGFSHWWLAKPLENLLFRSLEAIPRSFRSDLAFEAIRLPLPSERKIAGLEREWPELSTKYDCADFSHRDSSWDRRVSELIYAVGSDDVLNRTRAMIRMSLLTEAGVLSEEECQQLATAVWSRRDNPNGLPSDSELYPHIYLILPEVTEGLSGLVFHETVVKPVTRGEITAARVIAIHGATEEKCSDRYVLSAEDALLIFDAYLAWAPPSTSTDNGFDAFTTTNQEAAQVAKAIGPCLAAAVLPRLSANMLDSERLEKWENALQSGLLPSLLMTAPHLPRFSPPRLDWTTRILRKALASRHEPTILAALNAMFQFIKLNKDRGLVVPPILCSDVAGMCAVRREPGLLHSLAMARQFLDAKLLSEDDQLRIIDCLEVMLVDLDYMEWNASDVRTKTLSLLRVECVLLAATFKAQGSTASAVDDWLKAQENDPFPEVRFADIPENVN